MKPAARFLIACTAGTTLVFVAYSLQLASAEQLSNYETWPFWLRGVWFASHLFIFPLYIVPNLFGLVLAAIFYSALLWLILGKISMLRTSR